MTPNALPAADRRVQRTRKLIQDALIELTIQKGFAAVTVRDITDYAGVNRATFYRHYQDKFDLLDQYAQAVYQLLDEPTKAEPSKASWPDDPQQSVAGVVKMFEHIRAYAKFYRVMLGEHGDPAFAGKIQRYIQQRMRQSVLAAVHETPLVELYLSYVSSGSVGLVRWWLDHDLSSSPSDLAAVAVRLSVADMRAVLGQIAPSQTER